MTTAAPEVALRISDLTVRFGGLVALDGVGLSVSQGEVVGVIGPNGAGKTTLFNVVCGFVRPTTGRLEVQGAEQRKLRPHQLASLGIAHVAGRLPGSLPYPLQKRVSLARALVAEPQILLLDEPASGLSNAEMDELGELIRGLRGRMAVMLVEHHMDLVMAVCDRIVVLDFGKVIATGTPDEVRADPRVLAAYLGDEVDAEDESISEATDA